jgi:hypothetical protein
VRRMSSSVGDDMAVRDGAASASSSCGGAKDSPAQHKRQLSDRMAAMRAAFEGK